MKSRISIVPLCLSLMSAGGGLCFAANPPPYAAAPPVAINEVVEELEGESVIRSAEGQYRFQFEQSLYSELASLRRACKPDAKTFLELAKAAKAGLNVPLHDYARAVSIPLAPGGAAPDEPRVAVQKLLRTLAEAKLGKENARLYRQECERLAEAHKRAVIMGVVAALDERLVLTVQQRARLVESMSSNYENSWELFCKIHASQPEYWPSVPGPLIVPLLDESQKGVWQRAAKPIFEGMFAEAKLGPDPEIQEIARMIEEVKDGP